jgi:hypothetical protein
MMQQDQGDVIRLSQRMKPEERLVAHFYHSQFMSLIYQAGVKYRSGRLPSANRKIRHKR